MKKLFIYFLCVSFLLMTGQVHWVIAEAKEKALPIGEMVSKGAVKFEARENVWRDVESSHFPIFAGMKFKTEKGKATIVFTDNSQIEINPNSAFSLDQEGRVHLSQGGIQFRIPSDSALNLKVGSLLISPSRTLQASKASVSVAAKNEETIGSISIHSNGAATIKSDQGKLSVLDQNRTLLAGLSSKDSVTLPSTTVKTSPRVMTAQVGQTTTGGTATTTTGEFLGLSTWAWVGIAIAAIATTGVVIAVAKDDDDHDRVPICP